MIELPSFSGFILFFFILCTLLRIKGIYDLQQLEVITSDVH